SVAAAKSTASLRWKRLRSIRSSTRNRNMGSCRGGASSRRIAEIFLSVSISLLLLERGAKPFAASQDVRLDRSERQAERLRGFAVREFGREAQQHDGTLIQ